MIVKRTFKVNDMHCANCVMTLEAIEDDLDGVLRIEASYRKGEMIVAYDDGLVNEEQILEAVAARGYHAEIQPS